jgi:hypothetical protein
MGCGKSDGLPTSEVMLIPTREAAFATEFPVGEMNSLIRLRVAAEASDDLRIGSTIDLIVENESRETIWFPVNYGTRILTYSVSSGTWTDVANLVRYYSGNGSEILLHPRGEVFSDRYIPIKPDITTTGRLTDIRVVVIGRIYKDGAPSDSQVGAYIDIGLRP